MRGNATVGQEKRRRIANTLSAFSFYFAWRSVWEQDNRMSEPIGELLREWRTKRGLSLGTLAQRATIDKSTLSRWESGKTAPRLQELEAVLSVMGISSQERRDAMESVSSPRGFALMGDREDRPPVGGDLLRAMRLRQRMTQAQVARLAGVSQGRLAKWESGEDCPSAERLLTLCHTLNSHPNETNMLLMGRFTPSPLLRIPFDRENAWGRFLALGNNRWLLNANDRQARELLLLSDLHFLSLMAELWTLSQWDEEAYSFLTYVYGAYSRHLLTNGRADEATQYSNRALSRMARTKPVDYMDAVMTQVVRMGRAGKSQACSIVKLLQPYIPLVTNPQMRGWMYAEAGLALATLGVKGLAIQAIGHAFHQVERIAVPSGHENMEDYFRTIDHLKILVRLGDRSATARFLGSPQHAILQRYPNDYAPSLFSGQLALIQAYQFVGDKAEARNIRAFVDSHITARNLENQRPDWETLFPDL